MNTIKLLVAEDKEDELQACRDSVNLFQEGKDYKIEIVECKTKEDAFNQLDSSFDGAIIDLKLQKAGTEGSDIVSYIQDNHWRIPVALFTGTPDNANMDFSYVGVFKKGEITYHDLFDKFLKIYKTGITNILGGRGQIEEVLNTVFTKNILPQMDTWIKYAEASNSQEKMQNIMLRTTLNHLMQILENNGELFYPEEVYIVPPLTNAIKTGSIVKSKNSDDYRIVLNPACDLVIRADGYPKTDRYLLAIIENEIEIIRNAINGVKDSKKQKKIEEIIKNNHCDYYHWIPRVQQFNGGFINFRNIYTCSIEEFAQQFESPVIEISQQFVKDIIARFSSYYGRQGQPDIDLEKRIPDLMQVQ
jgi:hypothetical protein